MFKLYTKLYMMVDVWAVYYVTQDNVETKSSMCISEASFIKGKNNERKDTCI